LKQVGYIKASNPSERAQFGDAVALSGDGSTLAVGARAESSGASGINGNQTDTSAYSSGAVYVFARAGDRWVQQAYVKASNPGDNDNFGSSVALSGDGNALAVGAPFENSSGLGIGSTPDETAPAAGAAYFYTRSGGTWSQKTYVKASNTGNVDQFGTSVALNSDGNTLAVGAQLEDGDGTGIGSADNNDRANSGAAYLY
jgi:hypothetical protein